MSRVNFVPPVGNYLHCNLAVITTQRRRRTINRAATTVFLIKNTFIGARDTWDSFVAPRCETSAEISNKVRLDIAIDREIGKTNGETLVVSFFSFFLPLAFRISDVSCCPSRGTHLTDMSSQKCKPDAVTTNRWFSGAEQRALRLSRFPGSLHNRTLSNEIRPFAEVIRARDS